MLETELGSFTRATRLITTDLSLQPPCSYFACYVFVCARVEVRGQSLVSSSIAFLLIENPGLSLNLKLKDSA